MKAYSKSANGIRATPDTNHEVGTHGNDFITGTAGNDAIKGLDGLDTLLGRKGDDKLSGGAGVDFLRGNSGDDILRAGIGNDDLRGGAGEDKLRGGAGNDLLKGGAGDDFLRGGAGQDHLVGGSGADQFFVAGDGQTDTVTDFNFLEGDRINAVGFTLLSLQVDVGLGITTAQFDHNHDGIADASIQVNGVLDRIGIILGNGALPAQAVAPHAFGDAHGIESHALLTAADHHLALVDASHLAIA